jgi:Sec-independent protein secretion pathway component TatC
MSEIDELKGEVRRLSQMVQDTNVQVHKMRRRQRWHTFFQIVWWFSVLGITGAAYYYYVQPYVAQIMSSYEDAQGLQVQVKDWFSQFKQESAE